MYCCALRTRQNKLDFFVQGCCFVVLATVGMGTIGLALLAGPLSGYYADRAIMEAQERRLQKLRELYAQQEELLNNADSPYVIERVAISNLKYVPAEATGRPPVALPATWPALEKALAKIDQPSLTPVPYSGGRFIELLARQPTCQSVLLALGSALVIVSLSCFYRSRPL